jgi:3-hydroxyacyl-[acyl-carrier-protein] dehydratase
VDEITELEEKRILCKKTFTGNEYFFRGHYPGMPVVPGVLQCESALQAGAILLTKIFENEAIGNRVPVVAKMGETKFKQIVKPGDTLFLDVKFKEKMGSVYFLHAKVTLNGKLCVQFDFACALTEQDKIL